MNKEEIIARPYEEYYEMIKDMSKDNMIQGLYDLSKECIEKQNYINQLETNRDELKKWLEENRNRYIYQDGLGEDWYFEDLNVFEELSSILKGDNNENS